MNKNNDYIGKCKNKHSHNSDIDTIYDNSVNLQKKIITLREGQETSIWSSSEDENNIDGKYYSKNIYTFQNITFLLELEINKWTVS